MAIEGGEVKLLSYLVYKILGFAFLPQWIEKENDLLSFSSKI